MRIPKARPLGELRREAVRGYHVYSKALSVTLARATSPEVRDFSKYQFFIYFAHLQNFDEIIHLFL